MENVVEYEETVVGVTVEPPGALAMGGRLGLSIEH
jgi:hypothetical protein